MHEAKPFSKLTICLKPFRFVKKKCHNKFVTSDAFAVDIQQSNLTRKKNGGTASQVEGTTFARKCPT